jgi:FkbH-like protein
MEELISVFLAAPPSVRLQPLRELLAALKKAAQAEPLVAAAALRRVIGPDLDYTSIDALLRQFRNLRKSLPAQAQKKVAVLGSFTTQPLIGFIELYLFAAGLDVQIYESDYGVMHQEILDPSSRLHAFRPDILFLATSRRSLGRSPNPQDDAVKIYQLVADEVAGWMSLWTSAHDSFGCQIIQNNFDPPPWRVLSNHEKRHPAGPARFISKVNDALQDSAPSYVTIHDIDHLAATAGRWAWGDDRFYYHAKLPCAPEFLAGYAHSVASIITAQSGQGKKCLVLDLDNTLWGGVIGDGGIEGIRLGQGDADGEAFHAFQHYCRDLARRGVILAVCSKNTESVAREAFEKHPEMVLRLDDIACFVANWDDKASNLRRIAAQLDIGLDSLVFIDDNPAERGLVRQALPEVSVPELSEDPAGYIQSIDKHSYFQTVAVAAEDFKRGEMYKSNALRQQAQVASGNIDNFLKSIDMRARVEPVNEVNLERVAQLIARSNQFNLTTRRHSAAAVMKMTQSPGSFTMAISLTDRFGDNGLISVILGRSDEGELLIDTWLMSCRVLKRGVELFARNYLVELAKQRGLKALRGEYIPTKKNVLVRDHYSGLGFDCISGEPGMHSEWRLATDGCADLPNFIQDVSNKS